MESFKRIFGEQNNAIVGAIHLPPLLGYKNFPGIGVALKNTLQDLRAFEKGGVDGVIFENNYDVPHVERVSPEVVAAMTYIGAQIKSATKLPVGVSVLWNDCRTALSIAKVLGLQFVRIPAFVDTVQTDYGKMPARAKEVSAFRKRIAANDVALLCDVHVKHSKVLSRRSLEESAKLAVREGADALIVTGNWTGHAPELEKLERVRNAVGDFPVFVGSGADAANIRKLFRFANGAIVSTSLKKGSQKVGEVNVKGYEQRIDKKKVAALVAAAN